MERAKPPEDILPEIFFTEWIPASVASDETRGRQLGSTTQAQLVFALTGEGGGDYTLAIDQGRVVGRAGRANEPDLVVTVDVLDLAGAQSRRSCRPPRRCSSARSTSKGDFLLALKLHLILG